MVGVIALAGVAHADGPAGDRLSSRRSRRRWRATPNARIAVEEIRRAYALLEQTRAASMPSISAKRRLRASRRGGPLASSTANVDGNLGTANPGAGASADPAARLGTVGATRARERGRGEALGRGGAAGELASTVARTYLAIIAQRRVIEVSQRARATGRVALQAFAHQRFAGGYGNRVDEVARRRGGWPAIRPQVESTQAFYTRLRESLGVLVGRRSRAGCHRRT